MARASALAGRDAWVLDSGSQVKWCQDAVQVSLQSATTSRDSHLPVSVSCLCGGAISQLRKLLVSHEAGKPGCTWRPWPRAVHSWSSLSAVFTH
jgi:hypothetical protein